MLQLVDMKAAKFTFSVIILFFLFTPLVKAMPSNEDMECLVNRIVEDCRGYKVFGECEQKDGKLSCGKSFSNGDEKEISSYLGSWIQSWESRGEFVQYSPSPFGCLNDAHQSHACKLDSAFKPLWDGKEVSCPAKVNNWTIFGFSISSAGGITIVGLSVTGFSILGSIITLTVLIRKKRISIANYVISVSNK